MKFVIHQSDGSRREIPLPPNGAIIMDNLGVFCDAQTSAVEVVDGPAAPVGTSYGESRSKLTETWPLGRHAEVGHPPVRPVLLPVPDTSPAPAKRKAKT